MAKAGRPRKDDTEPGTRMVRLFEDLADLLSDLSLVLPKTIAQIVDPLLRPEIELLHERYKAQIETVKAAQKAAEDALAKARIEAAQIDQPKPTPKRPRPGS